MSLPPAPKDISDRPQAGSVVDPINRKQKDADVDRKIRFYGIIEAFRQGRMPDNKQIDETLTYVIDNSPVAIDQLSPDGQKLVQDTRDIIETARLIVKEKNADELFQNFVWHTRDVNVNDAKKDPNDVLPVDKEKARTDGQQAVKHLRTILSLVLTNSEVRKLLSDFSIIGRDLLAKGAAKAAEGLRPDEETLAGVDKPAAQDEFVTKGGRKTGPHELPVLEAKLPGTDTTIEQHPREDDAKVITGEGEVKTGSQVVNEASDTYQQAKETAYAKKDQAADAAFQTKEQGKDMARENVDRVQEQDGSFAGVGENVPVDETQEEVQQKKQGMMDRVRGVRDNLADRIPQQHKDRVNDHVERGRKFLTEEYFPEERRDQFIFRGKKVIIECQKHDDYQESIKWLLSFAEDYAAHGQTMAGQGMDSHRTLSSDPALQQATTELRTLLERFANGQSMNIIFDAANALIDDARRDEAFRAWFRRVDAYIRKILLEAGYVLEDECNREGNEIRDTGRQFYDDKYRQHFDNLFSSVGDWFRAMGDDPLNARFGEDWARLTRDLLFDSEGSLKFKPELWSDIRKVIMPTLIDKVGYVPIPRIEYTDDNLDLVVENLTLQGRNLFPNWISMEAHNFVKFSPYNAITDQHHHEFTLTFGQMQADMRDVAFYFRRKSGIPRLTDSGLADVILGGEGLTATVHLISADKDRTSVFKVKSVNVKVDTLKFSIRDSKHDFLYKTLKPLATGLVKKQIQKAIADAITTGMEYVDGQLVSVRDRMAEAKVSDDKSRTQVLQGLFQSKKDEASSLKSNTTSQFKVVHNKRNSVIETGHPTGWVNRTTEREEKAVTGEDWHSEAFTIV